MESTPQLFGRNSYIRLLQCMLKYILNDNIILRTNWSVTCGSWVRAHPEQMTVLAWHWSPYRACTWHAFSPYGALCLPGVLWEIIWTNLQTWLTSLVFLDTFSTFWRWKAPFSSPPLGQSWCECHPPPHSRSGNSRLRLWDGCFHCLCYLARICLHRDSEELQIRA